MSTLPTGGRRQLTAAIAALLLALAFAACGDGGDSTGSTQAPSAGRTGAESAASQGTDGMPSAEAEGKSENGDRQDKKQSRAEYERERYGGPSGRSAPFSKYSKQGGPHLHLAEFGEEAESGEREAAQAVVLAYLRDIADGDWESACSYLAGEVPEEISSAQGGSGKSCGSALEAAVKTFEEAGGVAVTRPPDAISSFRIESGGPAGEGAGFALFHGQGGGDRWIALRKTDGDWRLLSIAPQPFH